MKRIHLMSIGIVLMCASLVLGQQPTVTLKKIVEKREASLEKTPFSGWDNGIELTLHVDGPAVQGARQYGMVKVTAATDDAGTDLTKAGSDAPSRQDDRFEDIRDMNSFGFGARNAPKPTGFDFELSLPAVSSRAAKTIRQISGSIEVLVGGEKKVVDVKSIKQQYGKPIDDPALKAAGVTFTLVDPSKPGARGMMGGMMGGNGVTAEISGQMSALGEVSIVDARGEKISQGSMWSDNGPKRSITYDLSGPLPDNAVLRIEVWPGQKKVTVPFELKDVKLP